MSRWSIQRIKAMLLCIEYGILFVLSETKIKACNLAKYIMLCLSRLSILLSKHIHTFLPITFLIFNGFSICKKFWKAETHKGFSTIPSILYMSTLLTQDKDLKCIQCYLCRTVDTKHIHTFKPITFLIINGFSVRKKFWKAETQGFSTIPSIPYMSTQDKDL